MINRLSEEQKKLVENHHNIIYTCLKMLRLSIDEYYDLAAIGLCEAAYNFDSSRNIKFETFSSNCIKKTIYKDFRKKCCKKRNATVLYINDIVNNKEFKYTCEVYNVENEAINNIVCEKFIEYIKTNSEILTIVLLFYCGYKQKQIALMMGISQSKVHMIKKQLKKIILETL